MKKLSAFVAGAVLLMTGVASAASVTNVEFSNGDVTVQGSAGQSVSGKVRVTVPVNEEVEYMQFDIFNDNLGPVCVSVNRLQEGTHWVNIPGGVKFPPNTGTYDLQVQTAGIFGGLAAIDCQNNVNGNNTFTGAVRTVGSSSSSSVGSSLIEELQKQIADLLKMITELKNPPAPTKPAYCAQMGGHTVWKGQSGASVSAYQHFLIANGFSIPAGATGYFGNQTQAAATAMAMACK